MKNMLIIAVASLAGCCFIDKFAGEYPSTIDEGFVELFNGKDLSGWFGSKMYGVEEYKFKLNNGEEKTVPVLAYRPGQRTDDDRGNLLTEKEYRNFVLRFEFMLQPNGDCGLGLRVPCEKANAAFDGMCEIQMLDDGGSDYYDAEAKKDRLDGFRYACSVFGIVPARRDNFDRQIWGKDANFSGGGSYVRKPGMWNFEEVKVIGEEIEVWINGYLVTKTDLSGFRGDGTDTPDRQKHPGLHAAKGHLSWCGDNSPVIWKNIRIKELPEGAKMDGACPKAKMQCPEGFETYFDGSPEQLKTMWKGVTTEGGFDNPCVREKATPAELAEKQKIADKGRDEHWHVRNGVLYFDGYKGGYSLATKRDYADFELWADWRTLSITGDSGLYLRGSPQVQIWDVHNQWGIGSGGLYNNQKNPSSALAVADRQVGDWNRFHVIMRGESFAGQGMKPSEVLRKTNDMICANNPADMFVTVWVGILEISTGKLTASNAGHEYPALMKPGKGYEIVKDPHGFVVGGFEDEVYEDYELVLEPGSRLFLYTDGLAEAKGKGGAADMFGLERITSALNSAPEADAKQTLDNMDLAVADFVKDAEQFDDLTMLCLEYNGSGHREDPISVK